MIVILTTGGSCIGELLKVNNSLQELVMEGNPICDDGISSVADGLQCNITLTKLDVQKCKFSVKGTVVYKMELKIIWPIQFLVYSVKQDHFDQTDDTILSIEAIKGKKLFDHYYYDVV